MLSTNVTYFRPAPNCIEIRSYSNPKVIRELVWKNSVTKMESSGHAEEDIKEECVEIISSSDAGSAVTAAAAMFMSAENEAGSESNNVFMTDDQETVPGAGSGTMILRDREGTPSKPEKETVVNLIEMVRYHPQIWDITNAAYREKLLRKRSFRRIGEELGWSTEDVIKKYNNLRTYYTKEIIKQKRSPTYQSKWPYFDQLDSFLRRTVHKRQPAKLALANKWDRMQLLVPTGFRKKRQMLNSGDLRQRSTFSRAAATVSTPPVETSKRATVPSTGSSAGSRAGPPSSQINISHVRSLVSQQASREKVSPTPSSSRVPRQQLAQQQVNMPTSNLSIPATSAQSRALQMQLLRKQTQSQPQQQQKPQQLQQQHARPKSPPPATAKAARSTINQPYQQGPTLLPSPSSGQNLMESNDTIFGRLITSQLSKIPEGRKKEQLKINVMQQLVQAMFDEEQS
ncbi:uncharacterized protein LOC763718 isoform X2 [Strongylocentrotus purpuratus]|uniref:MADF domain-containing protein n=1 Tax=Strongylocentrotus purpuratus TaxID=7668 RepID=A0A7M7HJJ6_STRPU|nr:uncharacterized protein LOC763718 isoform X2 [Strongylocentrotus purpuratus]|eukprot:XP_011664725.1 PREDICTED: uncharacterized protein LOC763718 isoform X2 [Strongylocentrotus purpuratus]